jgi:hypothetical protein
MWLRRGLLPVVVDEEPATAGGLLHGQVADQGMHFEQQLPSWYKGSRFWAPPHQGASGGGKGTLVRSQAVHFEQQ